MARLGIIIACLIAFYGINASADDASLVSKNGNVTGDPCISQTDCIQGYIGGNKQSGVTCIARRQGTAAAPEDIGPGGLACGCLPDVKHCGYGMMQVFK